MSRSFSLLLSAGAALSALLVGAPSAHADDDTITITGRVPEKQTTSSVTVVTADDIARTQATTVFDALTTTPGVTGARNGGLGQIGTIRLRGASSGQTLTLIDGVPVNDTTSTSGYNYAFLDSGIVERIEVLRGAGSAIWGSDAIGGVVNIITFDQGVNAVSAYAEGGSFSTGRLGARVTEAFGPLTLSGYGTAFRTNGVSAADEKDGNPEKDGSDAFTLGGRASLLLGGGFTAQIGARTTQGHADFDDGFSLATGIADSAALYHSLESLGDANLGWRAASGRYGVNASISESLTKTLSEGSFGPFAVRADRVQERLVADTAIGENQTLVVGAEHNKLRALTSFAASDGSSMNAGFATYQGKFFDKLLLEGGARYEDDSRFGGIATGRIGAALDTWRGGRIRATLGNAYRAPSIFEVTGAPFKLPNPDLKPEKSDEWEVGLDQKVLGDAATISIVYFDQRTKDLIKGAGSATFRNVSRADSKGVELTANTRVGKLDLTGAYTYENAADRETDTQLDHVARWSASLDATWHVTDAFALGGKFAWNGKENDTDFGPFPATPVEEPSWTTLNLRASYHVSEQVEFYGRIENVADKHYEDVFGYGEPGRAAYIGIRVKQ